MVLPQVLALNIQLDLPVSLFSSGCCYSLQETLTLSHRRNQSLRKDLCHSLKAKLFFYVGSNVYIFHDNYTAHVSRRYKHLKEKCICGDEDIPQCLWTKN